MNLFERAVNRIFGQEITRQVREALSFAETDRTFHLGSSMSTQGDRDRYDYDREEILKLALEAWRVNPLARRIVSLTSQYVVGGGLAVSCKEEVTGDFVKKFWDHRLNSLQVRVSEWCDELTRTGNLFLLISTDQGGMSYVRAIPTAEIDKILTMPNDIDQEIGYVPKSSLDKLDPKPWPAYKQDEDFPEDGKYKNVMLHYAINRPVGGQWGESDLSPILKWLSRYANWLEDRARLNRFRTAFLYVVKAKFTSEAARLERQRALNTNPPNPGSILVTDEGEEWDVISPKLDSQQANTDGLALKKMISAGSGLPLHFLAEPESATRTTAEAAGGPTYRHFEQRQNFFLWVIRDLLQVVTARKAEYDQRLKEPGEILVKGADISARDNISMAMAAMNINVAFGQLRNRGVIDDAELLRMLYRFAGEAVDIEEMLERGREAGPILDPIKDINVDPIKQTVDPGTGKTKGLPKI